MSGRVNVSSEEELLQAYALNDYILSQDASSAENNVKRITAWRQQAAILQHFTKLDSSQYTAFEQHAKKLSYEEHAHFFQQRAAAVDTLLNDSLPKPSNQTFDSIEPLLKNQDLDETLLDSDCRGIYESCRYAEVTKEQLDKSLPIIMEKEKERTVENASLYSRKNATSIGRNTLSSYLKRPSSPPTATIQPNRISELPELPEVPESPLLPKTDKIVTNSFRTAREELILQMKSNGDSKGSGSSGSNSSTITPLFNYGSSKKSLGARRNVNAGFVLPVRVENTVQAPTSRVVTVNRECAPSVAESHTISSDPMDPIDVRLANIDPKMIQLITNEIMHKNQSVDWSDIAGLDYAKSIIKEAVVYPLLRPDIFTGLRRPPRGILLFGPPGTGKTLIGKCIASKSQSTFFSISASSLTSKWVGDGEKMVRALFAVAAVHQPSIVFIDEIDSLLSQRSENEHESSRRLKTEFLVQLDGAATSNEDRILIVGATNRPQELDEAARRRLVRRLYIPLPELEARIQILTNLLQTVRNSLSAEEIREVGKLTAGYSGADMESLCREASMEPIRSIPAEEIPFFKEENVRPVRLQDFNAALQNVRPSVSENVLKQYIEWNQIYGAGK